MILTKREAAAKVIREMQLGVWCTLEELANRARYGAYCLLNLEMAGFLCVARRKGLVENRQLRPRKQGRHVYVSEWRKIRNE